MSSKKIRTILIALLVLLGLAGGGYALVDHLKKQEEQTALAEAAALKLFSFDSNAVESVEITNPDGHFKIDKQTEGWTLTETDFPHQFVLNTYYLNVINSTMSGLTALQKIEADPSQSSAYGLDDPVIISCQAGGETYTLHIGTCSVTKDCYYVSIPGDPTVYGIDYNSGEGLRGGISYLRSAYMIHDSETKLVSFSLEHNGETVYDLARNDANTWTLQAPYTDVDTDTVKVSTILTELVRIEYSTLETFTDDPDELAAYGLDKPAYTFRVATAEEETVLQFAEFDPNDAVVYAYEPSSGAVSTLAMRDCGFLTGSWYNLISEKVLRIPFANASALDVTVDCKHFTLTMDQENGVYHLDDLEVSSISDEVGAAFEYLYASVSEISTEEIIESPALPESPVPACRFVYTLNDGTTRTLELVPDDDKTYWAYVDGRCIGQTVRRNALSGTSGVLNFLEKMTDALADEGITYEPGEAAPASPAADDTETTTDTASTDTTTSGESAEA